MKNMKNFLIFITICVTYFFYVFSFASNDVIFIPEQSKKEKVEFLFIQNAEVGTLHYEGKDNLYEIRLRKVDPWTIYFSNAPHRITGYTPTKKFLESYHKEITMKHKKGLNAAIITLETGSEKNINLTFTIDELSYNPEDHTLTYKVSLLPGEQNIPMSHDIMIEKSVLFIDPCAGCGGSGW